MDKKTEKEKEEKMRHETVRYYYYYYCIFYLSVSYTVDGVAWIGGANNGNVWMLFYGESLQMETEMLVLLKLYGQQ